MTQLKVACVGLQRVLAVEEQHRVALAQEVLGAGRTAIATTAFIAIIITPSATTVRCPHTHERTKRERERVCVLLPHLKLSMKRTVFFSSGTVVPPLYGRHVSIDTHEGN
jgi:hypothetical protein